MDEYQKKIVDYCQTCGCEFNFCEETLILCPEYKYKGRSLRVWHHYDPNDTEITILRKTWSGCFQVLQTFPQDWFWNMYTLNEEGYQEYLPWVYQVEKPLDLEITLPSTDE